MHIDIQAKDIMTTEPFTLDQRMSVIEAAELLVSRKVSNAPVVQKDFTREFLAGFISEKDVMQCYASGRLYSDPDLKVGDVMRPHPICVSPHTGLFALAAIFMQHGFRHLPVVSAQMLDGIVSRRDVLKALLEHYREWDAQDPATRRIPDLAGIFTPLYLRG